MFIKFVRLTDQLADLPTAVSFSSQPWQYLLHVWQNESVSYNVAPVKSLVNRSCVATTVFSQDFRHIVRVTAMDVDPHGRTCRKKMEWRKETSCNVASLEISTRTVFNVVQRIRK